MLFRRDARPFNLIRHRTRAPNLCTHKRHAFDRSVSLTLSRPRAKIDRSVRPVGTASCLPIHCDLATRQHHPQDRRQRPLSCLPSQPVPFTRMGAVRCERPSKGSARTGSMVTFRLHHWRVRRFSLTPNGACLADRPSDPAPWTPVTAQQGLKLGLA
jgi:hypothetical protein